MENVNSTPMTLIGLGHVEYVEGGEYSFGDTADAGRIKVRMDSDGEKSVAELDYAMPLMPKVVHVLPKKGEGVLIFASKLGEFTSQKYYVGPIISQPQFNDYCDYDNGRGDAVSLITDKKPMSKKPLKAISQAGELVKGSFPLNEDVALLGRGQEDVILRYRDNEKFGSKGLSEVDIRAGIRLKATDGDLGYMKGNVIFNTVNPAYIQVKHKQSGTCGLKDSQYDGDYDSRDLREGNSIINVVADKINLISHKSNFGESITDADELVKEEDVDFVMSQLHRSVYGDKLVDLLKLMVKALFQHQHPFSMLPPTIDGTILKELRDYPYEDILSPNVRIS